MHQHQGSRKCKLQYSCSLLQEKASFLLHQGRSLVQGCSNRINILISGKISQLLSTTTYYQGRMREEGMQQLASKNCKWAVEFTVISKNRLLILCKLQAINRSNKVFCSHVGLKVSCIPSSLIRPCYYKATTQLPHWMGMGDTNYESFSSLARQSASTLIHNGTRHLEFQP